MNPVPRAGLLLRLNVAKPCWRFGALRLLAFAVGFPVANVVAAMPVVPETCPACLQAPARSAKQGDADAETAPARDLASPLFVSDEAAAALMRDQAVNGVQAVRTRPLREIPPLSGPRSEEHGWYIVPNEPVAFPPVKGFPDGARQSSYGPGAKVLAPAAAGVSFDGIGVGIPGYVVKAAPPDTDGHVGATQYVQWNNTHFAVWQKFGALVYGPAAGNTLFQAMGGACALHNDGDPIVNYDLLAGRWVLSQFVYGASPNASHQCFAVSQTGDATGAYYLYDFVSDPVNFIDYPKLGVWPDGYYMTARVYAPGQTSYIGGRVYAFERSQMIQGLPARLVTGDLPNVSGSPQYGMLPADLDSMTPPPAGEAEFVIGPDPTTGTNLTSTRVAVTWGATPAMAALSTNLISVAPFSGAPCNSRSCIPQPPPAVVSDYLDALRGNLMYRLAYRNFDGSPVQESLVVNETVASTVGGTHSAIRWYELRNAGSSATDPTVFQQSTYDPDADWRWMGSMAMDKDHDIALGYNKSSASTKPGIFIAGRFGTDTVNTLGSESTIQAGGGSQLMTGNRWGDYSAMTLDPVDQCTFWYTGEYLQADGSFNWATRVATYRFPSCASAPAWGFVSGKITSCATGVAVPGVIALLDTGFAGASGSDGSFGILTPPGSYTATASGAGRNCASSTPAVSDALIVASGGGADQNYCMTGGPLLQDDGIAFDDASIGNNNGVINRNERVRIDIGIKNAGCATATTISATLSTTTPGVTVTKNTSAYTSLVIDAAALNTTAFEILTSNDFVCGTAISLTLDLTYAGGGRSLDFTLPTCAGGPDQTIAANAITLADSIQTDRIGRDSFAAQCGGKICPGGIGTSGNRNYKVFNFTNTAGVANCFTVDIKTTGCGGTAEIESAAYLTSYDPTALCTNYLGDSGVSGLGQAVLDAAYSVTVPAGATIAVVVNTTAGSTTCANFSGTVSGFLDDTPGLGPDELFRDSFE